MFPTIHGTPAWQRTWDAHAFLSVSLMRVALMEGCHIHSFVNARVKRATKAQKGEREK
jgi:hypothetical protein